MHSKNIQFKLQFLAIRLQKGAEHQMPKELLLYQNEQARYTEHRTHTTYKI